MWFKNLFKSPTLTSSRQRPRRPSSAPLSLEALEDRCVPATFVVKNTFDGPAPPNQSLRAAIEAANDNGPGLDTIVFKAGLEGTILLTGVEMAITGNLVLKGPGAAKITIDADAASRIFNIDDGDNLTNRKVTISGLTLFNGSAGAASGGAIRSAEDVTLTKTTIISNFSVADGGAIEASVGANLTVKQSRLSGNSASFGGAIDARGAASVLVLNSVITGNNASANGGGIWSNSITTIRASTISGNSSAGNFGGGIRQSAGSLTIETSTVTGNHSTNDGGGVSSNATTKIVSSTIQFNHASNGGGIHQQLGSLELQRCTVSGNSADNGGGVFITATTATSVLANSTIAGNFSQTNGGGITITGIAIEDPVVIRNCTISGNQATGFGGGVITFSSTPIVVNNSTIAFNRASTGGGIYGDINNPLIPLPVVIMQSTIVALNQAGTWPDLARAGMEIFIAVNSLVGSTGNVAFAGDAVSIGLIGEDPLLAPLAKNGGPTETHALKKSSPAINQGSNPDGLTTDQRGAPFKRKRGLAVDIGAFERQ